ncbi:MAG: LysR family transcriptional regulator [Pseudomonadota bacterium]
MVLDLKHVESFVAAADATSFSLAADRLGTVQSAVSAHIRALEHHLGMTLLDRGRGRPVALTPDGRAFLAQARRLLDLAEELSDPSRLRPQAQRLRLGTTVTFALSAVANALSSFRSGGHIAEVEVQTARSHALLDMLDTGLIDVAFVLDQ